MRILTVSLQGEPDVVLARHLLGETVDLVFETPVDMPPLFADESKVPQILRKHESWPACSVAKGTKSIPPYMDSKLYA
jgi:hypothetical protein